MRSNLPRGEDHEVELGGGLGDLPGLAFGLAEKLAGWLKTNAGKARKERQTLKKRHGDLVALGFTGSYNRGAAFARQWRAERQREQQTTGRGTFVPLSFRPRATMAYHNADARRRISGQFGMDASDLAAASSAVETDELEAARHLGMEDPTGIQDGSSPRGMRQENGG